MFMAFYDADIYIPLLVSSALQLFATINIILSSSSISTPISDFAVEAVMSYHGHWNIHDVIVIVPPKWSRVWSQLITSFRLNKILYDFLSSQIVMYDVKFTSVKCMLHSLIFNLTPWPPRKTLQGETRLLWGHRDRLSLLSKLRIWGPLNPLVNFYKCFIGCAVYCPDSIYFIVYTKQWQIKATRIQKSKYILHNYFICLN